MTIHDRAIACLQALATGDAIGKQTETLSRADVQHWYPEGVTGFHGRPGDVIPRYAGKRYEWRVGETTDDTEQTVAVMRAILRTGRVDHEAIGQELLRCKKSLHPGVSLWAFVQTGDPNRIAADGDGCGAAMRSAPIGILYSPARLDELVHGAYECAIPTHGGQMAICAAAAVAGAVSAAVEGRPCGEVLAVALDASRRAERLRPASGEYTVARAITEIHYDLANRKPLTADAIADAWFPDRPRTIVPLAIALGLASGSARETALLAANIGGDTDSVASIGGAIAGALHPETVDRDWVDAVRAVSDDDLIDLAKSVAALRR